MSEQLFETETFQSPGPLRRHLRSVATAADFSDRSSQERLDDDTIRTGRAGIERARAALRESRHRDSQGQPDRNDRRAA